MANIYVIKKGVEVFRINFFMSFFRFRDYGGFEGRLCTKTAGISLEGINFEIMTSSIYVLMEKKGVSTTREKNRCGQSETSPGQRNDKLAPL